MVVASSKMENSSSKINFLLMLKSNIWVSLLGFYLGVIGANGGADFSYSCPGIGFFGDVLDCRVYYVCTGIGKVGSPMKCDGDLAWNQKRLSCEWRRNLPDDICGGKKEVEEPEIEVEVFDPNFPTLKPPRLSTSKRFSGWAPSSRTSLPPATTSRLGNLTENDRQELAQKLTRTLWKVWVNSKFVVSVAFLTLL